MKEHEKIHLILENVEKLLPASLPN